MTRVAHLPSRVLLVAIVALATACTQAAPPAAAPTSGGAAAAPTSAPAAAPTSAPAAAPTAAAAAAPTSAPAAAATTAPAGTPAVAVAVQATSAPVAPTAAPATGNVQEGGSINVGIWQEPDFLTWVVGDACFACSAVMQSMWEPPLQVAEDGSLVPSLLSEVPSQQNGGISADGKTITLKLKPGLKWSDGQPLTVKDYVFTWKLVTNKDTGATFSQGWDQIDSIDTPSDTQAVVHLKKPFAPFLSKSLAGHYAPWMPEHAISGKDFREWSRAPSVVSGAFKFVEFVGGDHVTVEKNPSFYQPAHLDKITFKLNTDRASLLAQLKSGDLDAGIVLNEPDVPIMQADQSLAVYAVPGTNIEMWHLNERSQDDLTKPHPILSDLNVRKAIYYGLDRDTLTKQLLGGIAKPAVNWLDGTAFSNTDLKPWPYDPAQAKQLLDQAGWKVGANGIREKDGKPLHLLYSTTSGNQLREQIQVVLQQQMKEIGVDLEIKNFRPSELFGSFANNGVVNTGHYDIAQYADSIIGSDPDISHFYLSSQIATKDNPSGYNWTGVNNPDLDTALNCELESYDVAKRTECLKQAQKIVYDNVYDIFLYDRTDIVGATKKLHGIKHQADPVAMWLGNTAEWWLEQ